MDVGLLFLTMLSLATAAGLGASLWRTTQREEERGHARIAALRAAMGPTSSAGGGADGPRVSFGTDTTPRLAVGSAHRFIRMGVGASMALVLVTAVTIQARWSASPATVTQTPRPLELMSMRHTIDGSSLTVSGVVHTPASAAPHETVTAVVSGFDGGGVQIATGSGPVDLAAGADSSFSVAVPGGAKVARYRMSFRAGQTTVRHVDRRIVASVRGM